MIIRLAIITTRRNITTRRDTSVVEKEVSSPEENAGTRLAAVHGGDSGEGAAGSPEGKPAALNLEEPYASRPWSGSTLN